ncbi:MAG: ATP-binding cassette domain-containing protein [Saprospiraceae bacterium]|nr:ATP-binding cassette domain-containing protein [Candidatus Vicinibacter affinis]MBP6172429.1 ATP-binding cassette domain-containing protein [Saprospiraceae bacterium]MBK6822138.1 ATP-binding cassette domain-containing protein [Candidatus Vicinibacter affinis]MBK7302069.1 ATP-binding cassette domain-containing protein [Candidatus Vicinibacter affinis]MBK7693211.1 ATP-binding cassette domain-containing protein [Candidatus Vicinibacter affinis]
MTLHTHGLGIDFKNGKSLKFPDLSLVSGETLLIHGPSGSGKTSLLHMICGLMNPSFGEVKILNQNIQKLSKSELDFFRGQHIGICLQRPIFIKSLTVLENLILARHLAKKRVSDHKIVINWLEKFNLINLKNRKTFSLSLGEQQRLMFIRALVTEPDLILADEPTSSLDDVNAELIADVLLNSCHDQKATLVVVSHDARLKSKFSNQISLR